MILLITTNGVDHLSDGEVEVMKLAAVGFGRKAIAAKLGISLASVRKRMELLLSKLNIVDPNKAKGGYGCQVVLAHLALHLHLVPNLYLHLNGKKK